MSERLDKQVALGTALSRKEATALIRRGAVTVDGEAVRDPARKVEETAAITVNGQAVICRRHLYILLNKPAGVLCVSHDDREQTVVDVVPDMWRRDKLFPAGRLDRDTTGMVILTDDGDFAHRMLAPGKHVPKRYRATLSGEPTAETVALFASGMTLDGGDVCLPAELEYDGCEATLTLHEGKFHQVKRMLAARGTPVTYLKRLSMGALALDESLAPGEWRELTAEELKKLQ